MYTNLVLEGGELSA